MSLPQQLIDIQFMRRCLDLARKGSGNVSPNPMVGAIIVKGEKVLGVGYHRRFGGPHAEVNAIRAANGSVRGATLYVNLEPCNIYGKTPPCTDLIISSKLSRVVIGMNDPNPLVAGRGISQLRDAGIQTTVGVLQDECSRLNESFSKYIRTGLPFVTLKVAQTLDGKIAGRKGHAKWITGGRARTVVHMLRSQHDAVLVGARTLSIDDPRLTVRRVKGRSPVRVILDGRFTSRPQAKVFSQADNVKKIVVVSRRFSKRKPELRKQFMKKKVNIIELEGDSRGKVSLRDLLRELGKLGISSLLVEGGSATFSAFIKERVADKLVTFIAPMIMGPGLKSFAHLAQSSSLELRRVSSEYAGADLMVTGYLH